MALLFQHPRLINLNAKDGGRIPEFVIQRCIVDVLGQNPGLVDTIESLGDRWSKNVPLMEDDQQVLDQEGKPLFFHQWHKSVIRDLARWRKP